jgi:hypothetical protein
MYHLERDTAITGELLNNNPDCSLRYNVCTNTNVKLVEDPYEADVNNTPGQLIWTCDTCYNELCLDI